jgi:hypothetical protein
MMMTMRPTLLRAILILATIVVPLAVKAQIPPTPTQPPKEVFRVDTREPADIFAHGFTPWGSNDNLIDHVGGTSCTANVSRGGTHDSAFIATTDDQDTLERIVRAYLGRLPVGRSVYIYTIRADANFYSAQASVELLHSQTVMTGLPQVPPAVLVLANTQHEWLARQPIPGSQVIRYRSRVAGYPDRFTEGDNAYYGPRDTQANSLPYTLGQAARQYAMSIIVTGAGILGACFLVDRPNDLSPFSFPELSGFGTGQADMWG